MSVQVAIFERMFDHGEVPALALSPVVDPIVAPAVGAVGDAGAGAARGTAQVRAVETVHELQARIDALQRTRLDTRLMPTHEAIADLLPGGGLRERGATLLVLGPWPQAEAMISVADSRWAGLGEGHGLLSEREVTLTVTTKQGGRPRSGRLLLPDAELGIRRLDRGAVADRAADRASDRARERWQGVEPNSVRRVG